MKTFTPPPLPNPTLNPEIQTTSITSQRFPEIEDPIVDFNPEIIACNTKTYVRQEKYVESGCLQVNFAGRCNLCEQECSLVSMPPQEGKMCIVWEPTPHPTVSFDFKKMTFILASKCILL